MVEDQKQTPTSTAARQRFVRAVNIRVNNALEEIRKVGKLSSDRYDYGPDDVVAIMDALQRALDEAREQLLARTRGEPQRITIIEE